MLASKWSILNRVLPGRRSCVVLGCAAATLLLAADRAGAESGFLADGGSIGIEGSRHSGGGPDEFLEDGGSISASGERHGREREFLQDGGSITSSGDVRRTHGYRDMERPQTFLKQGGSIVTVYDAVPRRGDDRPAIYDQGQRTSPSDGVAFRGDDGYDGGYDSGSGSYSVASIGLSPAPRIIDVESARLDRRPIGPGGIDVIYAGGAKIIRIAPGYSRQAASVERSGADLSPGDLEPWSREWLLYCMNAYASFDPNLGTYETADGGSRFCTGE